MEKTIYFIHDVISDEYKGPFMYTNDGEALRDFVNLIKNTKDIPAVDLELVNSGWFISYEYGSIGQNADKHIIATGRSVLNDSAEE